MLILMIKIKQIKASKNNLTKKIPHAILGQYYKDYILLDWALSYRFLKLFMATFSINLLNTNFIDFDLDSKGSSYVNSYQHYLPGHNYLPIRNYWFSMEF